MYTNQPTAASTNLPKEGSAVFDATQRLRDETSRLNDVAGNLQNTYDRLHGVGPEPVMGKDGASIAPNGQLADMTDALDNLTRVALRLQIIADAFRHT